MKPETLIKSLIWLYVALLIFEGALRKWVLPGLSDALLVVRDPVVILIYLLALGQARFPFNGWLTMALALACASLCGSFLAGQDNVYVTLYGLRTNYMHLPLIWVMANVLTRRDVERICQALLLLAIPMTGLMVLQYNASPTDYINRGVGTDEGMGQIYGALGHIRPPGFFSFITGPNLFYPLVTGLLFAQLHARRRLWWPLLALCGMAIAIAIPVSISRALFVASAMVGAVYLVSLLRTGFLNKGVLRLALIGAVVLVGLGYLPIFDSAREAFLSRWVTAASGNAVGIDSVTDRVFGGGDYLADVLSQTTLFGHGIGMGSSVAAKLTTGQVGFLLAENEWAKVLLELGLVLGLAFLAYRFVLALAISWRSVQWWWAERDALPLLLTSASVIPILSGQWAQPTILGFTVVGSGLALGAMQHEEDDEDLGEDDHLEEDDHDVAEDST